MSDILVAKALAATNSFVVKLRNFILVARNKDYLVCVFEGDDHHYYGPRIDAYLPSGKVRKNFPMDGKVNLIELYGLRKTNDDIRNADALYFTDKDYNFDVNPPEDKLYVTPCYSVENFYLTPDTIDRILSDAFKVPMYLEKDHAEILNPEFAAVKERFCDTMILVHQNYLIPINAFILAAKSILENDASLRKDGQLAINDFSLTEYVQVTLRQVIAGKPISIDNLAYSLNAQGVVTERAYSEQLAFLRSASFVEICRGKYSFEVLKMLVNDLWKDSRKTVPKVFRKKREVKNTYSNATALADLSAFAGTPACLKRFLQWELQTN